MSRLTQLAPKVGTTDFLLKAAKAALAEASDARGNHVTVEQENWWHQFRPGSTKMPRPISPMVISGGAI